MAVTQECRLCGCQVREWAVCDSCVGRCKHPPESAGSDGSCGECGEMIYACDECGDGIAERDLSESEECHRCDACESGVTSAVSSICARVAYECDLEEDTPLGILRDYALDHPEEVRRASRQDNALRILLDEEERGISGPMEDDDE
jgi:hypothetical protein